MPSYKILINYLRKYDRQLQYIVKSRNYYLTTWFHETLRSATSIKVSGGHNRFPQLSQNCVIDSSPIQSLHNKIDLVLLSRDFLLLSNLWLSEENNNFIIRLHFQLCCNSLLNCSSLRTGRLKDLSSDKFGIRKTENLPYLDPVYVIHKVYISILLNVDL